ncbi:MAG: MarR family winged helix-turn-helix transcriptional regulator [Ilumatobacteraceae bacterium]
MSATTSTTTPGGSHAERAFGVDLRDPVEADLAYRISLAWRELRRGASTTALRDHFFGVGDDALEPGQMDALDVLLGRQHWRMSELAEALRVDPSTATRTVQRLVKAGLAVRHTSDDDGRVVLVGPSPEGRRRHRTIARRRAAAMARLLAAFETDEREQLADLLERFVGALDDLVADLDTGSEVAGGGR